MNLNEMDIECDRVATQEYCDKYNEPCTCSQCIHFRESFSVAYPDIACLLSGFGINVMRPLEIIDMGFMTKKGLRAYNVYFSVKGQLPIDKIESKLGEQHIILRSWTISNEAYANTGMKKPYFIIEIQNILLRDVEC